MNAQQPQEKGSPRDRSRRTQLRIGEDPRLAVLARAWLSALKCLSDTVNRPTYEGYIRRIEPKSWTEGVVTLAVPSAFAREWLKNRYADEIEKCLSMALANRVTLQFVVEAPPPPPQAEDEGSIASARSHLRLVEAAKVNEDLRARPSRSAAAGPDWLAPLHLDPRFTFDRFEAGSQNRMAREAAVSVAEAPGGRYNPLVLVGPSGVGKTHLLHSVAHQARELYPDIRIGYLDGESFTHRFLGGGARSQTRVVRDYADAMDLWLVDDIQFIAGQEQVRDEIYHLLNELFRSRRQVVMTTDRLASELPFEERIVTRLEGGLVLHVSPPELESRMAIVHRIARDNGEQLPGEVAYFIANGFRTNVRSLEGAVARLLVYCRSMLAPFSVDVAAEVLSPLMGDAPLRGWMRKGVSMEAILAAVAQQYDRSIDELRSGRLDHRTVRARQVAMFLCRQFTEQGYTRIGQALGGRDHATVKRGAARIERLLETDPGLRSEVTQAQERFAR